MNIVLEVTKFLFSFAWISQLNGLNFYFSVIVVRNCLFLSQITLMIFLSFAVFSIKRGYTIHKNSQTFILSASIFVSSGCGARKTCRASFCWYSLQVVFIGLVVVVTY